MKRDLAKETYVHGTKKTYVNGKRPLLIAEARIL